MPQPSSSSSCQWVPLRKESLHDDLVCLHINNNGGRHVITPWQRMKTRKFYKSYGQFLPVRLSRYHIRLVWPSCASPHKVMCRSIWPSLPCPSRSIKHSACPHPPLPVYTLGKSKPANQGLSIYFLLCLWLYNPANSDDLPRPWSHVNEWHRENIAYRH